MAVPQYVMPLLEATWSVAEAGGSFIVFTLIAGAVWIDRPGSLHGLYRTLFTLTDSVIMAVSRYIVYGLLIGGILVHQGLPTLYGAMIPVVLTAIGVVRTNGIEIAAVPDNRYVVARRTVIGLIMIGSAVAGLIVPIAGFASLGMVMVLGVIFWRL